MASSAFKKALAKKKQARKLMETARKAETNSFEAPDIGEGGEFVVRVKARTGITPNKGIPFVEFKWVITEGEHTGKGYRETVFLTADDPEQEERSWTKLGRALKVLSDAAADSWELADLDDIVEDINDDMPVCRASLKPWKSEKSKGINCFFNARVAVIDDDTEDNDDFEVKDYVLHTPEDGEESEFQIAEINGTTATLTDTSDDTNTIDDVPFEELILID